GNEEAAENLWRRYFEQLVVLARGRLQRVLRRAADGEDVALSAFATFCINLQRGRYPQLHDRDDLWHLLAVLTARTGSRLLRTNSQQKRGGAWASTDVRGLSSADANLDDVIGAEPTPAFAAQVAEEFQRLLGRLGDAELERVALRKMEGYSNEEIAGQLACTPR